MKTFQINPDVYVVCEIKDSRSGFTHHATLVVNGVDKKKAKRVYCNRTWESFPFETVVKKVLRDTEYKDEKFN